MPLDIDIIEANDRVIVKFYGKVDSFTQLEMNSGFERIIKKRKKNILLIFKDLSYISNKGIGAFINFAKWVERVGGQLKISEMHPSVRQIFRLLSHDRLFSIYNSTSEAIESFREGGLV